MKKVTILLLLIITMPLMHLTAQNTNLEKLNTYKIGFFTKRLNLTSQEAEKFWPVYNEYQAQKNLIQLEKLKLIRTFNQSEGTLSDSQVSEIGDKLIGCITQESALSITLHKKLKEVLPPGKVIRFYQAENQYKAQLLNELQNTTPQQRQNLRRKLNQ
jgi:paraquat-inducible protein B